jgi:hypothetical protein
MVSMGRIEWLALSGDEVETLLANLIYNRDGRAIRIRPAQGDYGIDIVIPTRADPEKWDVYQVKKFAQNLTADQKSQIVTSFGRVLLGMVRRNVPLNDWYLVLPLDPTLENLDWLKGVPERAIERLKRDEKLQPQLTDEELERIRTWLGVPDRIIDWKGLPFCESLAAAYPYVVDYYLHGGRERLREAVADLAKLLGRTLVFASWMGQQAPVRGRWRYWNRARSLSTWRGSTGCSIPIRTTAMTSAWIQDGRICGSSRGWSRRRSS